MQKKDILLGVGLTSVLVGAGVVNTTVQADELTQPTTSTTVQKAAVTGQDLSRAQEVAKSAQTTIDQKTNDVKVAQDQQLTAEKAVADVKEQIKMAQKSRLQLLKNKIRLLAPKLNKNQNSMLNFQTQKSPNKQQK